MSTNQLASSNPSAPTTTGAGDNLTRAGQILQIASAIDVSRADTATLRSLSSLLGYVNTTVIAAISDKRATLEADKEAETDKEEEKKAKKQRRIQRQLGEHVTTADDPAAVGRGVFQTPVGKRSATMAAPNAPARIRTGRNYQADLPEFDPDGVTTDRGDTLNDDPVGSTNASITAVGMKKRRPCGTPGCILRDNHAGPHSTEAALPSRRLCVSSRSVGKKPEEAVAEKRSGSGEESSDDEVKEIISGKRVLLQTTTSGKSVMGGSAPVLVAMDSRRSAIIDDLKKKFGSDFGGEDAGVDELVGHFTALLLIAGYSEGSYDKEKKCQSMDGTVYKYPRYLRKFMEAGVFVKRSDFFADDAKEKATAFATKYGIDTAKRSPKYADMNNHQKSLFEKRHKLNLMHGFDDFVKLSDK